MAVQSPLAIETASQNGPNLMFSFPTLFNTLVLLLSRLEWERWRVLELFRRMIMFLICFGVWVLRLILLCHPNSSYVTGFLEGLNQNSDQLVKTKYKFLENVGVQLPNVAVYRALSQVLNLVNGIPVSSEKYEFARNMADKIIHENMLQGDLCLKQVNRIALSAAFARTFRLLTITLEGLQTEKEMEAYSWPWKLFHTFLVRGLAISPQFLSLENLRIRVSSILFSKIQPRILQNELFSFKSPAHTQIEVDCILAEKLALELFWMTQKLTDCSAIEEAIFQWSSASCLANRCLSAHPRVQCSVLRVCVLLFKELPSEELKAGRELKLKLLLLWLPLFCCARNGYDAPLFTPLEKAELVVLLERIIMSLPHSDQEIALTRWLQEYTRSSSDWPNLQRCFEGWYHASCELSCHSGWNSRAVIALK